MAEAAKTNAMRILEREGVPHTVHVYDPGQGIDGAVDVEQGPVVGVEVGTDGGGQARGLATYGAETGVAAVHTVHIGRRTAQVGEIAFEVW